ncbi:Aste57867_20191 [Aphanomyces stellatus]|uniref:Aste57867_20191 protein n=1 Tax=Aphanomyces stellatus TaxID=120398 RepID=A0A485LEF5_9STRA|nr:hypothetical protein As57867_020125 [Aphanomyces stellatus]VFT96885.1 Aste57867_20191 [Aphanomyces stellatus]
MCPSKPAQPTKVDDHLEEDESDCTREGFVWGLVMLLTGTFCTIFTKAQFGIRATGTEVCVIDGVASTLCYFDKPWFGVVQMKFGMAGCLAVVWIQQALRKKKHKGTKDRLMVVDDEHDASWHTITWVLVPAALDLLCTILANVGLLWISSSIQQMTKGSLVLFNALVLVQCMGKRLFAYQYVSIAVVVLAITLVAYVGLVHSGSTSTTTDQADQANIILGFVCILLSQFVTAWQIVTEEWLLTEHQLSPAVLVGWEGLWGLLFFVVLGPVLMLTPAGDSGMAKIWHEDFTDTFVKLRHSSSLVGTIFLYCICTGVYNFSANCVTKHLSSVMCSILDTMRALGIWIVALALYYVVGQTGATSAGEQWTAWSWLELTGFVLLVVGTLMYKKVIRVPVHALYEAEEREHAHLHEKTPLMVATV